jgi:hypothetical protein
MAVQVMTSVIPWLEEGDLRDTAAHRLVSLMLYDSNHKADCKAAWVRLGRIDNLLVLQACVEHHQSMLDALLGSTSSSSSTVRRAHSMSLWWSRAWLD